MGSGKEWQMHKIGLPLKFHTDGYECEISENLAIYVRVKMNLYACI